ncbi:DUF2244 domain-containing protein [Arenicella xantha]|uniref:Putative membrane protein n=1 Tax=Arenicella xantha TaxID=644221 RepID=A0A395JQ42_9GAMM|nr:DUF2244 domain-containing protein [Arenicella xantha]RBP53637.1 putative membrane protein [Arenicella xantha]
MVEFSTYDGGHQLVLSPNRSMSWQTNKKILLALFVVNMSIAAAWAMMGAWMIMPFAGLEVLLVGLGMYYASWKLSFKEIITVRADSIVLQKGVYFPKQEWQWQLSQTRLLKQPSSYRMSPPTLRLKHVNEQIEIGRFLNRDEKIVLREHLLKLGTPLTVLATQ